MQSGDEPPFSIHYSLETYYVECRMALFPVPHGTGADECASDANARLFFVPRIDAQLKRKRTPIFHTPPQPTT